MTGRASFPLDITGHIKHVAEDDGSGSVLIDV